MVEFNKVRYTIHEKIRDMFFDIGTNMYGRGRRYDNNIEELDINQRQDIMNKTKFYTLRVNYVKSMMMKQGIQMGIFEPIDDAIKDGRINFVHDTSTQNTGEVKMMVGNKTIKYV